MDPQSRVAIIGTPQDRAFENHIFDDCVAELADGGG